MSKPLPDVAFTTRLPFAVLIVLGVKKWDNRSSCPVPITGRCGMSVSRSSDEYEYMKFVAFVKRNASKWLLKTLPTWDQVKNWRGKMVAIMDYEAGENPGDPIWDEGYRYWWRFSNVSLIENPFPVRGNVGMWTVYR